MADTDTKVLFVAGFGPIDHDIAASRELYAESLGISFKEDAGGYLYKGVHGRVLDYGGALSGHRFSSELRQNTPHASRPLWVIVV